MTDWTNVWPRISAALCSRDCSHVKWVSEVSLDDQEFFGPKKKKIVVIVKANKFKIEKFLLPEYFLSFSSCNPTKTLVFIWTPDFCVSWMLDNHVRQHEPFVRFTRIFYNVKCSFWLLNPEMNKNSVFKTKHIYPVAGIFSFQRSSSRGPRLIASRLYNRRPQPWPSVSILTISPPFPLGLSQCDHWKIRIEAAQSKPSESKWQRSPLP